MVWNLQLPRSHASYCSHGFPNPCAPCFHRIRSFRSFRHHLQLSPRCQNISTSQRDSYWILGSCKSRYCHGWSKRSFRSWIEDTYFGERIARIDVLCTLEVFHGSVSAFLKNLSFDLLLCWIYKECMGFLMTNIHMIADGTIKGHEKKHTNEANNWNLHCTRECIWG